MGIKQEALDFYFDIMYDNGGHKKGRQPI